tara:strand:- start:4118 stop:4246 length:129 start_codon:yes stop_codon:yes gene_type:complete
VITDPETKPAIAERKNIVVAQQTGKAHPVLKDQFEVLEKLLA